MGLTKIIIAFAAVFIVSAAVKTVVFANAADVPDEISVGLESKYAGLKNIPIKNAALSAGFEYNGAYSQACAVSAAYGFSVSPAGGWYIMLNAGFSTYDEAAVNASAYKNAGYAATAGVTGSDAGAVSWHVFIGGYSSLADAGTAQISGDITIISPGDKLIALYDGGNIIILFDGVSFPQFAGLAGQTVDLGERSYRGRIEFISSNGLLTAVNVVGVDDYLYGVVPSEAPSSWPIEALKAQAVAARTYAVSRISQNAHEGEGYSLCDGIHCQVYAGAGAETDAATEAVDETSGIMVYYDGAPINAVYFSSSGGATDDSENVWGAYVPYLRAVKEINETVDSSWTRTFTLSELTELAAENGAGIGNATDLQITRTNEFGRVTEIAIVGTLGTKIISGEAIRWFFAGTSGSGLQSRNFTIENGVAAQEIGNIAVIGADSGVIAPFDKLYVIAANTDAGNLAAGPLFAVGADAAPVGLSFYSTVIKAPSGMKAFTLVGSGSGHGAGMSQYGAKGMAELGYTYDEILRYYYTGVEVK